MLQSQIQKAFYGVHDDCKAFAFSTDLFFPTMCLQAKHSDSMKVQKIGSTCITGCRAAHNLTIPEHFVNLHCPAM